tara:strand:- start:2361 stop:4547 length:2187 start_codon:yes stop_codon:yes gene_type:complete
MTAFVQVALAIPLRQAFTYSTPSEHLPPIGVRVRVPFGHKEKIGIVVEHSAPQDIALDKIKPYLEQLDAQPLFSEALLELARFTARYYFSPLGQVLQQMLPTALRQGHAVEMPSSILWRCTAEGEVIPLSQLHRAPKQQEALKFLQQQQATVEQIKSQSITTTTLNALTQKGWIERHTLSWQAITHWRTQDQQNETPLQLNQEQQAVLDQVELDRFQVTLIDGVTGSGKTEVYLQLIEQVLQQGKQVLVLVPEIGLTPQTISRFEQRFDVPMVVLHSHLSDQQRKQGWMRARTGDCALIIGTRSALFTPLKYPGLIVIDEEHDISFKQQEGTRYHARDLAIVRARLEQMPIILGSATPSLETLYNAKQGRYQYFKLNQRAGAATFATHQIVDVRQQANYAGLSQQLLDHMQQHLAQDQQVLLFLNRRGFAPALLCQDCGYLHPCDHCDAHYTVHTQTSSMHCHHCGAQTRLRKQCQQCHSCNLLPQGLGTQQLESYLKQTFPHHSVIRIDRDNTQKKGELHQYLAEIQQKKHHILIGTQMLAKGHHFPDVTLVGVLEGDQALFQADFRAAEKFAQLYTQVAGRAGRAQKQGHVMLQTRQPDHPLLQALTQNDYSRLTQALIQERHILQLPPYQSLLTIKAQAKQPRECDNFTQETAEFISQNTPLKVIGPLAAPMARKAGYFRQYIMLQAQHRTVLQQSFEHVLSHVEQLSLKHRCKIIIDRDPLELY